MMLKFAIDPKIGYKLLLVSQDGKEPFAKVWTYSKSPAWYASIREKKPRRFINKMKRLAMNDALEFIEKRAMDKFKEG